MAFFRTGNQNRHFTDSRTQYLNFDGDYMGNAPYESGYYDALDGKPFEPLHYWNKVKKRDYRKGFNDCRIS